MGEPVIELPEGMTPEQRLTEIAAILARGFDRLRPRSPEKRLDVSGDHTPPCEDRLTAGEVEVM